MRLESVTCQQEAPPLILLGSSAPPSCVPAAVVFIAFGNYYDLLYCYYYLYYIMTIYYYDYYCVSLLTPCMCRCCNYLLAAPSNPSFQRKKRGRTQPCPLLWPAVRHRGSTQDVKSRRRGKGEIPFHVLLPSSLPFARVGRTGQGPGEGAKWALAMPDQ